MPRQIVREVQAAQPSPHRLSPRVCYRSLDNTDAAFALLLSAEMRSRLPQALRHATQKRQREFLAGRWCARQALQCLGAGSTHVGMAEDRAPIWPDGVVGSITHTGGRSFCEFCTLVFSAKESVFKCLFPLTRKFLEFSDVRITSIDWHRKYFTWTAVGEYIGTGRLSHADGFVHTSVEMPPLASTAE